MTLRACQEQGKHLSWVLIFVLVSLLDINAWRSLGILQTLGKMLWPQVLFSIDSFKDIHIIDKK